MAEHQVVFESEEIIFGAAYGFPKTVIDCIHYTCLLRVRDGGDMPVSMNLKITNPLPTYIKMPKEHTITAKTITTAYVKVIRFFKTHKVEFRG